MKLVFNPNQEYQNHAIQSVVKLFEGQPLENGGLGFAMERGSTLFHRDGVANNLELTDDQLLTNLQSVQKPNGISQSNKLEGRHFSIEMETGTGKTYVYLRTIYELNKTYGFRKFVIVVPSVAIREGVLKNLEITHEHFQNLYNNIPINFEVYDSKRVSNLRNFAASNAIQILVLNIDAFAKDENIINKPNDKLTGKRPIEFIQNTQPIVIVDEPQNMETEIRRQAIENLNYLCTLRYSATHIKQYNLVYSLNPVQAYDLGLVKQIEVDSVFSQDAFNKPYLAIESIKATKTKLTAKIIIDINGKKGVERKTVTAKTGDDLYQLSNQREVYQDGYFVNYIDAESGYVSFSNGEDVYVGQSQGGLTDAIMKYQIEQTILEHLTKEKKYKEQGIKVLSLFFIDRVANYRSYDENGNPKPGKFAEWFEEIYAKHAEKPTFAGVIPHTAAEVHNGYFAQDKKGRFKDSSESRSTQADDDVFHLIMTDKERLLDIKEPLRFIFSHSVLREGWDNPNVFQICTLNETKSELRKRQEIGRGLRLAVNQNGVRVHDRSINRLTVIANESYEDFARKLQNEIEEECGVNFTGRIKNKEKAWQVKYRKGYQLDERFKEIWNRIKHKTTYRVYYSTADLVANAAKAIDAMPPVNQALLRSEKVTLTMSKEGVGHVPRASGSVQRVDTEVYIPDIISYIQSKTRLTRKTIVDILKATNRLGDVLKNPQLFLDLAVAEIQKVLTDLMIEGIKYEKVGNLVYEMLLFDEKEIEFYLDENTFEIEDESKTIYSALMPLDSSVEHKFAAECENREDVLFYFKLPSWFKIKTPIGTYNPDWALIKQEAGEEKKIYFVAETKGEGQELRGSELYKIRCGAAHFKQLDGVDYRQVSKVGDLN